MADGSIKIGVDIDEKGFGKELKGLETQAKGMASNISNALSKAFKGFSVAIASVGTALGGLGLAVAKVGKDFEAQMSKVEAISGSTAEEMERLEAKAKELGATTQFSATEAGQALEYMALAGFKTEDMLDSLPGVMDLAAASGEDLALVSSILTGGLSAFGLSAKEAGRFADVLASASSNSNTNVAMLGESFKYVAPLAGALGFSIEDTATALGLMANANIQASQAGTSLRAILSNLTSTSKPVVAVLNELGVTTTTVSGEVLPLNNILQQLRESFSGLSEAQQAQYAKTLAGADGMSGLLAIVNASEADFNKLSGAINNSAGTAGEMAKIMNDNLAGAIKNLESALEGIALSIYEGLQTPLKDITNYLTEMVQQLQEAFNQGGLTGLVNSLGDVLSDMLLKLAEKAPQILQIGIDLISSFLKGINSNAGALGESVSEIITILIQGFFDLFPQIIETGAKLLLSFLQGISENLPSLIDNAIEMIETFVNIIIDNFPLIIDVGKRILDQLVTSLSNKENLDKLINSAILLIQTLVIGLIDFLPELIFAVGRILIAITSTLLSPENLKKMKDAGKEIIKGLINGIKSMFSNTIKVLKDFCRGIVDNVKAFFKIKSPSRLFRDEIGSMLVKGMIVGVEKEENNLVNALTNPYDVASKELNAKNNTFSQSIISSIHESVNESKKISNNFEEVGKNIVNSLSEGINKIKKYN